MYSTEIREKAIQLAKDNNYSDREIGRRLNVDHKTVKKWTMRLNRPDTLVTHNTPEVIIEDDMQWQTHEKELEESCSSYVRRQGMKVYQQVNCLAGVADVVTSEAIYEMKSYVTVTNLKDAIGQVLLYRQCINPR